MVLTSSSLPMPTVIPDMDFERYFTAVDWAQPVLLTTPGWLERGLLDRLDAQLRQRITVRTILRPNPRVADVVELESSLQTFDGIFAIGGGSVIDSAKAIVALRALCSDETHFNAILNNEADWPSAMDWIPIVAVPTTSGSGSEVTPWGTVWTEEMAKLSVHHPQLRPTAAILDPSLCMHMPRDVTLASGLDALSHAMEAIWNRKHSPESDRLAGRAIALLFTQLHKAVAHPNLKARREVQAASAFAGAAMAMTQTALSHSISYALTARYGLPHGLASSLCLGEIARFNADVDRDRIGLIAHAAQSDVECLPELIHGWMSSLGMRQQLALYLPTRSDAVICTGLIHPARASNNLRHADEADAARILLKSLSAYAAPSRP